MSSFSVDGEPGSLKALCSISKRACEIMTPMIVTFYNAINGDTAKLKEDKSVFTIADGTNLSIISIPYIILFRSTHNCIQLNNDFC